MKLTCAVVAVAMLGLPLRGMAAEAEATPPAAAAPESAPPPSPDPAAATAPAPAPAEGDAAAGSSPPPEGDASSTWEDPPATEDPPASEAPPPVSAPPVQPDDSVSAKIKANADLKQRYDAAKRWAIGGGISAGVGLVVLSSGAWLAVTANPEPEDAAGTGTTVGRDLQTAGLVMVGVGGVAFAAGAAVMVVGLVKRKHVIEEAKTYPPVAVVPWGGKNGGGLSLTARF